MSQSQIRGAGLNPGPRWKTFHDQRQINLHGCGRQCAYGSRQAESLLQFMAKPSQAKPSRQNTQGIVSTSASRRLENVHRSNSRKKQETEKLKNKEEVRQEHGQTITVSTFLLLYAFAFLVYCSIGKLTAGRTRRTPASCLGPLSDLSLSDTARGLSSLPPSASPGPTITAQQ